jgi:hypothetical protein
MMVLANQEKLNTETTHTHELVDGATDVPHEFLECYWIPIGRLIPRLKLAFPFIITWPLCRDDHITE